MLQVKSFKIADGEGISELLRTNKLAPGASILVTNGEVAIPYEDGEPDSPEQIKIDIKESIVKLAKEIRFFEHEQRVTIKQREGAIAQFETLNNDLEEAKTNKTKDGHDTKQTLKEEVARLDNVIQQYEIMLTKNQGAITEKSTQIGVYQEELGAI